MATIIRLALLSVLVIALAGYIGWRYVELGVYRDLKRFFDASGMLLPMETHFGAGMAEPEVEIPGMEMLGFAVPNEFEDLKGRDGNLIEFILERKPNLPEWIGIDPFSPPGLNRLLELRYGRVDAPLPPLEYLIDPDSPVWFVVGSGPSRKITMLEAGEKDDNEVVHYRLPGAPYDASNGLFSQGYLYADSLGRRLGRYDPFYPGRR